MGGRIRSFPVVCRIKVLYQRDFVDKHRTGSAADRFFRGIGFAGKGGGDGKLFLRLDFRGAESLKQFGWSLRTLRRIFCHHAPDQFRKGIADGGIYRTDVWDLFIVNDL